MIEKNWHFQKKKPRLIENMLRKGDLLPEKENRKETKFCEKREDQ